MSLEASYEEEFDWRPSEDFACGCHVAEVGDMAVLRVIETEKGRWMSRVTIDTLTLTDADLWPLDKAKERAEFLFSMLAAATGLS